MTGRTPKTVTEELARGGPSVWLTSEAVLSDGIGQMNRWSEGILCQFVLPSGALS